MAFEERSSWAANGWGHLAVGVWGLRVVRSVKSRLLEDSRLGAVVDD